MNEETRFQKSVKDAIKEKFPNSLILKQQTKQGIPDLLILNNDKWVALECKISGEAHHQPNQDIYISKMNEMSYASFIFPENKEEVLNEVYKTFES
ncbi:MAG: hypothetical protein J6Y02_16270 [Pseudobutyrivibrio sp.]|nr:hypothetical protein [Pseudobutyrivibrio sp.]